MFGSPPYSPLRRYSALTITQSESITRAPKVARQTLVMYSRSPPVGRAGFPSLADPPGRGHPPGPEGRPPDLGDVQPIATGGEGGVPQPDPRVPVLAPQQQAPAPRRPVQLGVAAAVQVEAIGAVGFAVLGL